MKKTILFLSFFAFTFLGHSQVQNYNLNDVVDDFTVTDTEGVVHNLYEITASGKYVYLDFFFDTCPPCQQTQPIYNELHDKYGCNEGDIFVISINNGTDTNAEVIAFENQFGGPFNHSPAVGIEGGCAAVDNNFGITAYPTYCLINPDNEIINLDIWPISDVSTYENALPAGFEPEPMECGTFSIEDANVDASFLLYPNPISNSQKLTITLATDLQSEVKIYNVLGKEVYSNTYSTNQIEIQHNLDAGTYFVSVETDFGVSNKGLIVR